jgi:hypothetical protein
MSDWHVYVLTGHAIAPIYQECMQVRTQKTIQNPNFFCVNMYTEQPAFDLRVCSEFLLFLCQRAYQNPAFDLRRSESSD